MPDGAAFQTTSWWNAKLLPLHATTERLRKTSLAIRQPVTQRYTAKQGCGKRGQQSLAACYFFPNSPGRFANNPPRLVRIRHQSELMLDTLLCA